MDIQAVMDRRVEELPATVDPDLSEYLQELVGAGEADIALVTLIETLPQTLTTEFVDSVEAHYAGSGDYVEPQALTAVTKYRQQLTA